ncbi:methyl-accepting chemotaxis protein [Vreelandella jeotgali]|uniref:methyl-accepting chemotaxis protein n=1 Tax=Vreelandella jeotgali TaxID=553386 RepID=UPI00034C9982|nr:methyl-accepting chemotaxis protein [Halomonas jeotgali]
MQLWNNLTMRMSWTLVLLAFLILLLALSGTGLYAVEHSRQSIQQLTRVNVSQQSTLNRANSTLQSARIGMAQLYQTLRERNAAPDAEARQRQTRDLAEQLDQTDKIFQRFLELPAEARHATLIEPVKTRFNRLLDAHLRPQLKALKRGNLAAYQRGRADAQSAYDDFYQDAVAFFHTIEDQGNTRLERFDRVVSLSTAAIIAVFLMALLVTAVVYWGVGANLIRPIRRIIRHFETMAEGDLSHRLEQRGSNEIGQLYAALNHMQQALLETVTRVRESGGEVYTGARHIAQGNQDLSARTERQSASLTQTASSIEEMTSTMERSSDNASRARRVADDTAGKAEDGSQVVNSVVERMQAIRESSQQITDIITMIDGIAFQTNILALNASVEAARAGEHGRGFAVVASEVRQLANRSASAATDIRRLIDTSAAQVEAGAHKADQAGETMSGIIASVKHVTALMEDIDGATREQRSGIREINTAVNDMEQTTQQNAAMVEQASTGAQQLQSEADRLNRAVARFTLPGEDDKRTLPAP